MSWLPTTDDDFPLAEVATQTLAAMREYSSGQAEMSGFDDDDVREWTVVVVDGTHPFAVHIDWKAQQVITATREAAGE